MLHGQLGHAILDYDVGSTEATAIGRYVHTLVQVRHAHGNELADEALAAQVLERAREVLLILDHADYVAVYEDHVYGLVGDLEPGERVAVLDAQVEGQLDQLLLLAVGGDVGHECQIFDQTARLTFGRVRGTQHAPLRRLQRTRSRHFARFLKLDSSTKKE